MMPVIRVSEGTWERMKLHARPLEDTADDIVRRALDALEGTKTSELKRTNVGRPRSSASAQKLPQREFREPLLKTLLGFGGGADLQDVKRAIFPLVKSRLLEGDYQIVSTGEERWWNAICWERSELVKAGLLRSNSPRGRWELSESGRAKAAQLKTEKEN